MSFLQLLQPLFQDTLVTDDREALTSFKLPGFNGEFEVYPPMFEPWKQQAFILLLDMVALAILAAIVYTIIIPRRGQTLAYLVGYGFIIPFSIWAPFYIIEQAKICCVFAKFALFCIPTHATFRCVEAMHGTSPPCVEASLSNYVNYYVISQGFIWDPKTNKRKAISTPELLQRTCRALWAFFCISMGLSLLLHYDYKPFESPVELDKFHFNLDLLRPGQLANNFLYSVFTFHTLNLGFTVLGLSFNIQGFDTTIPFKAPLWKSKSPSDFWGRRWNLAIHAALKGGVYEPLKKGGFSNTVAILVVFFMSGLLHDYCWAVLYYRWSGDPSKEFVPIFGKQIAFFMWCGATLLLERPVGSLPVVQWMSKNLPTLVVSTLIVLTAVPVAHWYTGDWIVGRYWDSMSLGVMIIRYKA